MATYIMLSSLTDDGRETIMERPERISEVNQEVEALGARVVDQWAVLGPYDFVNIVEAPDNETIARVSVTLSARGTVQFLTLPALPIDAFIASLAGGGQRRGGRTQESRQEGGQQDQGVVNPIEVQRFLKGVDYPASKAELLQQAEQAGADERVRATLQRLPDQEYQAPTDVSEAIGQLE
jgi:uncharacterized protein with GYD domain